MRATGLTPTLPGGASERTKRGKEKVVTRAVAHAGMVLSGTGAGNTVLVEQA